jgi:Tol biopolymer transport system component
MGIGKIVLTMSLLLAFGSACNSTDLPEDMLYLGQPRPEMTPHIFAPGIVSKSGQNEFGITFSPEGDEIYYSLSDGQKTKIMVIRLEDGIWSDPAVASYSDVHKNWGPFMAADGQTLFFTSDRPPNANSTREDPSIWVAERDQNGDWGEPEMLPEPVSTEYWDGIPFIAQDGTLVFISTRGGVPSDWDIYFSKHTEDGFVKVGKYPEPINTINYIDEGPILTNDMQYFIFASTRPGGHGGDDIYIKCPRRGWAMGRTAQSG